MTRKLSSLNADGTPGAELRYTSFGEMRASQGELPTAYRYTGQLEEPLSGLYYYNARWYDPALPLFIQPDTLVPNLNNPLDWNRYAYVRYNPVKYIDSSGHSVACGTDAGNGCEGFGPRKIIDSGFDDEKTSQYLRSFINNNPDYQTENDPLMSGKPGELLVRTAQFQVEAGRIDFWSRIQNGYFSNIAILWGFNGSASAPSIYYTGGLEEIVILKDGKRAIYNYGGEGNAVGAGANVSAYGGIAVNVKTPDDYRGISASMGVTVSILDVGFTISYFWNGDYPPFTPEVVQGIQIGYAPGAQVSAWWSNVVYNLKWQSR